MQDDCFCDEETKKEVRSFNRTSFSSLSARQTGSVERRPKNPCRPLRKHFSQERLSKTRLKSSRTAAETFLEHCSAAARLCPLRTYGGCRRKQSPSRDRDPGSWKPQPYPRCHYSRRQRHTHSCGGLSHRCSPPRHRSGKVPFCRGHRCRLHLKRPCSRRRTRPCRPAPVHPCRPKRCSP